jgi:hypothetical protein
MEHKHQVVDMRSGAALAGQALSLKENWHFVVSLLAVAVISGCSFQLGRSAEEQERDDKIIEMYMRGGEIARQAEIKKARE